MSATDNRKTRVLLGLTGLEIGGGIASVAHSFTRALDELAMEGCLDRVDRVLLQDDPAAPPAPPPRGDQQFSRDRQRRFVWQLWRSLRRHRHDFVLFDQLGPARSTRLPLPGFPPRYAIFCHGIELEAADRGQRGRTLAGAWRLLTNSERTAEQVRRMHPGVADRIRVTPLCIDPRKTAVWAGEASAAGGRRSLAALMVGRMWSEERGKGHDAVIEAWARIRRRLPDAELWIAGAGDDRPRLEEKAARRAPSGVRFLGRVSDAELGRLYQRAAVFVMPSRQEGFGLVYAEALWHGLPCIASTRDAAGEVIEAGETGLLVPFGDVDAIGGAMQELLSDAERCSRMGDVARRRARERFGYANFRAALLAALDLPPASSVSI